MAKRKPPESGGSRASRQRQALAGEQEAAETEGASRQRRRAVERRRGKLAARELRLVERDDGAMRQALHRRERLDVICRAGPPADGDELLWFIVEQLALLPAFGPGHGGDLHPPLGVPRDPDHGRGGGGLPQAQVGAQYCPAPVRTQTRAPRPRTSRPRCRQGAARSPAPIRRRSLRTARPAGLGGRSRRMCPRSGPPRQAGGDTR